jgi:hypothetical protein
MIDPVNLYGLVDARLPDGGPREQVVVFYVSRGSAERALRDALRDEALLGWRTQRQAVPAR